ncbi:MAG: DEAD/DEAH box helicase [candidate division KSB1 bacterium]|nr:DEAD/DEAH box helicase [candidate division KSB1 bacterium]
MSRSLEAFSEPVRTWFAERFGTPTPPQEKGWPPIQRGENTLILSPTGSGKTLAAFLWGIDRLITELRRGWFEELRLVYVSPLKALNNDIERNLREPLRGIQATARRLGLEIPRPKVAVRSGDTPARERRTIFTRPPHILITTPESLYILLTHPLAPQLFRSVRTVIVDEIHALAANKRGVHLALSLERLERLAGRLQRIGLSATIRPLEEVAHFLGGNRWQEGLAEAELVPRPVTTVDASFDKPLELLVETPENTTQGPGSSWVGILNRLAELIRSHRTTLIFVNNRRTAERVAEKLNEILASPEGDARAILADGVPRGLGYFSSGTGQVTRKVGVHHGSLAREQRLQVEEELKSGKLAALVGTSSLELGIDIGTVDLVVQIESPKSVARGLQRIGRSGHLVGMTSRGRIFPLHPEDAFEAAVVARGIRQQDVEPIRVPRNPLDVLAQQIVAMVSVESWDAEELFRLVRQCTAFESLSYPVFERVLEMLSGRYQTGLHRELRPRILWDRRQNRLTPLPGARTEALVNAGTIPDQGTYGVYLADGKTRLGELDEEFVFETRVGDTFLLGSQVWRVLEISNDRLIVTEAPGSMARMPFWRGDYPWRPLATGKRVGELRRRLAEALLGLKTELSCASFGEVLRHDHTPRVRELVAELKASHALCDRTAQRLLSLVADQLDFCGCIASDTLIVYEAFEDALGDLRIIVHSPLGGRVNAAWALALRSLLRDRLGFEPETVFDDDAVLVSLPPLEPQPLLNAIGSLRPEEACDRVLKELPYSALFGARFRQNAARALLLPGLPGKRRTPFWLQRLRAKDLLETVRGEPDFPILLETFRECLEETLDLEGLKQVLTGIEEGTVAVRVLESHTPSPLARRVLWKFTSIYLYEWDEPKGERGRASAPVDQELLSDLLSPDQLVGSLHPRAIERVRRSAQAMEAPASPRSPDELALLFQHLGDLSEEEVLARLPEDGRRWLLELEARGLVARTRIPTASGEEERLIFAEYQEDYQSAFQPGNGTTEGARERILGRFLAHSGPVSEAEIRQRYALPEEWLRRYLDQSVGRGELISGRFAGSSEVRFCRRELVREMHRLSLAIRRREVEPVTISCFQHFLTEWQHVRPGAQLFGREGIAEILRQLEGYLVPLSLWEEVLLALRIIGHGADLDELVQAGDFLWIAVAGPEGRSPQVTFFERGEPVPVCLTESESALTATESRILALLRTQGASFGAELVRLTGLSESEVNEALRSLVFRGLVTNDALSSLRQLLRWGEERIASAQGERGASGLLVAGSSWRSNYREAKRRARKRVMELLRERAPFGRWSATCREPSVPPPKERAEHWARILLRRYGVVAREWLSFEPLATEHSAIWQALHTMELRGEIRGGYFIRGLRGGQFALPEAIEALQRSRDELERPQEEEPIVLNALDPACLPLFTAARSGIPSQPDWPAFARREGTWIVLHRGSPVLVAEDGGRRLRTTLPNSHPHLRRSLEALLRQLSRLQRRITVEVWNGRPAVECEAVDVLRSLGFFCEPRHLTWERDVRLRAGLQGPGPSESPG